MPRRTVNTSQSMPQSDAFLARYLPVQENLRAYVLALVRDPHAADDILQEVAMALWRQGDGYDPARPFLPWALGVARNHVARWRRDRARDRHRFAPAIEEGLAVAFAELECELDQRRAALHDCLERLGGRARDLLRRRYADEASLAAMAHDRGQSLNAVNKALGKVRSALLDCTGRALRREGA